MNKENVYKKCKRNSSLRSKDIEFVIRRYYDQIKQKQFTIFDYFELDPNKRVVVNHILHLLGYRRFSSLTSDEFRRYLKQHGLSDSVFKTIRRALNKTGRCTNRKRLVEYYQGYIHRWIYKLDEGDSNV